MYQKRINMFFTLKYLKYNNLKNLKLTEIFSMRSYIPHTFNLLNLL